jgi:hypothetical protein
VQVHAPPFYHRCLPLVASISVSADCNAADCTDPHCPVHRPKLTPQPPGGPQSQTESAAFGGLPLSQIAAAIVGGASIVMLLSGALTLVSALFLGGVLKFALLFVYYYDTCILSPNLLHRFIL